IDSRCNKSENHGAEVGVLGRTFLDSSVFLVEAAADYCWAMAEIGELPLETTSPVPLLEELKFHSLK
ncbi:unnamed protein product, partial [Nezara viridula]